MTKTNRLTLKKLAQIRERAEKATEGPWIDSEVVYVLANVSGDSIEWDADLIAEAQEARDATFIAHAREDIPNLLAHIDKQSEEIRYYKGYADRYADIIAEQKAEIERMSEEVDDVNFELIDSTQLLAEVLDALEGMGSSDTEIFHKVYRYLFEEVNANDTN